MAEEKEPLDPQPAAEAAPSPVLPRRGGKRRRAGLVLALLLVCSGVAGGWL